MRRVELDRRDARHAVYRRLDAARVVRRGRTWSANRSACRRVSVPGQSTRSMVDASDRTAAPTPRAEVVEAVAQPPDQLATPRSRGRGGSWRRSAAARATDGAHERPDEDERDEDETQREPRAQGHSRGRVAVVRARTCKNNAAAAARRQGYHARKARVALWPRSTPTRLGFPQPAPSTMARPDSAHRRARRPRWPNRHRSRLGHARPLVGKSRVCRAARRDRHLQAVFVKTQLPPEVWERFKELTLEDVRPCDRRSARRAARARRLRDRRDRSHDHRAEPARLSRSSRRSTGSISCSTTGTSGCAATAQRAIFAIRNEIEQAIHDFFYERGFLRIDTPILTAAIGERSGLFATEYFDEGTAYLAQTGQLYGEAAAAAFGRSTPSARRSAPRNRRRAAT